MVKQRIHILLLALCLTGALVASEPLAAQDYQVVVSSSNPVSSLSNEAVAKLLLRKTTTWDHGLKVQPLDQAATRSVRRSFSQGVHGKSVSAIKSYWQKMIFSGRSAPPPELTSDQKVLEYVRNNSGAIGYVSAGVSVGNGVKVVRIN